MQHARFAVKADGTKWSMVSYHDFVQKHGGCRQPRSGVLDILASACAVSYMDASGQLGGARLMCRPQILKSASGSVTYSATENGMAAVSRDGLLKLSPHVPFAILEEARTVFVIEAFCVMLFSQDAFQNLGP